MADVSIVIITKDQEWNTTRLIESVLERTAHVAVKEIVLVDSASADQTVDIAQTYPIRILRLHANQRLTAAAGRYIGFCQTTGDYVLFLDGDMELCEGWVDQALEILAQTPDLAVITGFVIDLPKTAESNNGILARYQNGTNALVELQHGGGAALYRRSVLKQVGPFNPYLYSDEEPELCLRIRQAGYRVARIEYPIAFHFTDPRHELSALFARRSRNLYLGFGQNIRYHLSTGLVWMYLLERRFALVPVAGLLAGFVSLVVSIVTGQPGWFGLWLFVVFLTIALDAVRRGSLHRTIHSVLNRLLIIEGSIRGFTHKVLDPEDYPAQYDIIQ
jgi:glycosyltransferase involved in cell wall biosynthesis